jgi:hypothetical protein
MKAKNRHQNILQIGSLTTRFISYHKHVKFPFSFFFRKAYL